MEELTTIEALIDAFSKGKLPKLLCFWRPDPDLTGSVGRECMSQWHESGFDIDGVHYRTAEHWMMAEKARLFNDDAKRAEIIASGHPGEARKLGREVRGFIESTWQQHRSEIVTIGNVAKFTQNPELRAFMEASRDRVLVEASPRDRIWGIGLEAKDPRSQDPSQWQGQNLLGFALMEARRRIGAR